MALALPGLAAVEDGAVDVDAEAGVETVRYHVRARAGAGFVAVVPGVRVGGDDAEEFAVLLQAFFLAGVAVFAQGFAFVEQLHPPRVVHLELLCSRAAELADFEVAFCDVKRSEMQGICGAFVFQDQNIGSEIGRLCSAGVTVGWREAIAIVSLATI